MSQAQVHGVFWIAPNTHLWRQVTLHNGTRTLPRNQVNPRHKKTGAKDAGNRKLLN